MSDFLSERRHALESSFFAEKNAELLRRLRAAEEQEGQKRALADATGIEDEEMLDRLVELGIHAETVAAMGIVPLLEVAWADRRMETNEREAILSSLDENGIANGSTAYQLVASWLAEPLPTGVVEAWYEYMNDLCPKLNTEQKADLMTRVVGRAEDIAEAAGGILGIGGVSASERQVLDRLKDVFV